MKRSSRAVIEDSSSSSRDSAASVAIDECTGSTAVNAHQTKRIKCTSRNQIYAFDVVNHPVTGDDRWRQERETHQIRPSENHIASVSSRPEDTVSQGYDFEISLTNRSSSPSTLSVSSVENDVQVSSLLRIKEILQMDEYMCKNNVDDDDKDPLPGGYSHHDHGTTTINDYSTSHGIPRCFLDTGIGHNRSSNNNITKKQFHMRTTIETVNHDRSSYPTVYQTTKNSTGSTVNPLLIKLLQSKTQEEIDEMNKEVEKMVAATEMMINIAHNKLLDENHHESEVEKVLAITKQLIIETKKKLFVEESKLCQLFSDTEIK